MVNHISLRSRLSAAHPQQNRHPPFRYIIILFSSQQSAYSAAPLINATSKTTILALVFLSLTPPSNPEHISGQKSNHHSVQQLITQNYIFFFIGQTLSRDFKKAVHRKKYYTNTRKHISPTLKFKYIWPQTSSDPKDERLPAHILLSAPHQSHSDPMPSSTPSNN